MRIGSPADAVLPAHPVPAVRFSSRDNESRTPGRYTIVAWLLLAALSITGASLYFNLPAIWNAPAPRRADRLFNAHPPIAYRIVGDAGLLHRVSAWCHGMAAMLAAAGMLCRVCRTVLPRALTGRVPGGLPAVFVMHLSAWYCAVFGNPVAVPAVIAAMILSHFLFWWRGALQHAWLILAGLFLTALAPVAGMVFGGIEGTASGTGPTLAGRYTLDWLLLLGSVALLSGMLIGSPEQVFTGFCRTQSNHPDGGTGGPLRHGRLAALALTAAVVVGLNTTIFWYRQPLPQFGVAVPGVLYHSGQPGRRGLAVAQRRYGFRTIVYVHPSTDTKDHLAEVRFAAERRIHLIVAAEQQFRPEDFLRLVRDREAQPILLHCIEGKRRTPAWLALYRIADQQWSLEQAYAEMERMSGDRLRTELLDWVARHATRLASR